MSSIQIRCDDDDMRDQIMYELESFFKDMKDEHGFETDLNYDETRHGGKVIKVEHGRDFEKRS